MEPAVLIEDPRGRLTVHGHAERRAAEVAVENADLVKRERVGFEADELPVAVHQIDPLRPRPAALRDRARVRPHPDIAPSVTSHAVVVTASEESEKGEQGDRAAHLSGVARGRVSVRASRFDARGERMRLFRLHLSGPEGRFLGGAPGASGGASRGDRATPPTRRGEPASTAHDSAGDASPASRVTPSITK